jgi:hypothetical protein
LASVLRVITEDYLRRSGLDIKLDHGGGQSGDGHVPGRVHPRARADARLCQEPAAVLSRQPSAGRRGTDDRLSGRISQGKHVPDTENVPLQNWVLSGQHPELMT